MKEYLILLCVLMVLMGFFCGCSEDITLENKSVPSVKKVIFGVTPEGAEVELYSLVNAQGLEARIMTYGAILVSLETPDRNGALKDITLGYDTLDEYIKNNPYFGATIGRYGNRIGKGKFTLEGAEYALAANDGENHLHGGLKGFDKVVWDAEVVKSQEGPTVKFSYLSEDGEEGYPGNFQCTVIYTLTNKNELKISYEAETDKTTVVNLTHHSYFNLTGAGQRDILEHELMLNADRFTPVDEGLIPMGELRTVKGTPMDFTTATAIGARINDEYEQLKLGQGYDHNWVLNKTQGELSLAARVYEPSSGRVMEIYTTEPGIQFYSGNFLDGSNVGKGGRTYQHRYGFCLETQHFPDSPNQPDFPSVTLRPGEKYTHLTVHKFFTR
ncbi:aldose epimerase family protein [Planctomycetota bacterium]